MLIWMFVRKGFVMVIMDFMCHVGLMMFILTRVSLYWEISLAKSIANGIFKACLVENPSESNIQIHFWLGKLLRVPL